MMTTEAGVYLIKGERGQTRIAYTQDVQKRFSEWQAASPLTLDIVGGVETQAGVQSVKRFNDSLDSWQNHGICSGMKDAQRVLIGLVKDLRVRGEWFDLCLDDLKRLPLEWLSARVLCEEWGDAMRPS